MKLRSKDDVIVDIVVAILMILTVIIVAYPLYFVIIASFSDPLDVLGGEIVWLPKGFSLDAYKVVFKNDKVLVGYKNTFLYTISGTILNLVLTIMAAYPLSKKGLKGHGAIMGLIMFTMFFGGGLIPTYIVVKNLGLLDSIWAMILPGAISVYNVMVMRTYFSSSIPGEIEEAALIDGADYFRILLRVILPLSKPIIAVIVLYYAVAHWNGYFQALIYLSSEEKYPLQLILRGILLQNQSEEMIGDSNVYKRMLTAETMKYALIIISSVPVMILYPFVQKHFVKGVMIGSVKG